MWIRYVAFRATTDCCYNGNKMLYRGRLDLPRRTLTGRFRKKPTDDIREWAETIIRESVFDLAENACKELADDYEACDIDPGIIYTSETFVGPERRPPVKEVKEVVPEVIPVVPPEIVPVKVPFDVPLRIARIQDLIKEAETYEEKMAFEEELKRLKERYRIK